MICFYLPNLEFVSHFAYLMMMGLFVNMKVILFVEERRIFSDWNGGGDSEGLARAEDTGRSIAKEAAEAVPPGKRPLQWKSATFSDRKNGLSIK